MALPALPQNNNGLPAPSSPAHAAKRDLLPAPQTAAPDTPKRRADDSRRLRRVKDSREQLKSRTRARGTSNATIDTTTSNSTAAGRSYTVANVHNGVIYLRPVVRPGNQRGRPQPDAFVFPPQTPPDSATRDTLRPLSDQFEGSLCGSSSPQSEPSPPLPDLNEDHVAAHYPHRHHHHHYASPDSAGRPPHGRSHSFSIADDHAPATFPNEPGTFKVVIERPGHVRPKTADTSSFPMLQVPIPHYRLGTPRFSTRGTVDLRSSVYTGTSGADDFANSLLVPPHSARQSFLSSRSRSDAYSPVPHRFRATMDRPPMPLSGPSSARVSHFPISPRLYDALAANPDDRAVVRFNAEGDILAATPSRLVAHITSPSFLDYELLSDFFLTFRAFLCSRDLVAYLIARLRWAVDRQDDFGRIVRVRTFVALRHWILNYFVDDFMPFYRLRVIFCDLVNSLYNDLRARHDGGGGDINIVGELKKCWRRTCALYWDTGDPVDRNYADGPLLPGGVDEGSQPWLEEPYPIQQMPSTPPRANVRDTKETVGSNPSDHFASRHMDWAQRSRHTPQNSMSTPFLPSQEHETPQVPISPSSDRSIHVLSCSIPKRGTNKQEQNVELPLYPHPVPATQPPAASGTARLAGSPQQPTSLKNNQRPDRAHKRSGSFSDALRDSRAPLSIPKNAAVDYTISAVANMPGTLVRGGLIQPGSPYFQVKSLRSISSHHFTESEELDLSEFQRQGQANAPGMKKILGSVRRALSTRQQMSAGSHLSGSLQQRQAPYGRSSNPGAIPTTSVSGTVQKRRTARPRPQMRMDVLAATVVESFRRAVQEQLESEGQENPDGEAPSLNGFEFEFDGRGAPAQNDTQPPRPKPDPRVHSNITSGSKSIVIIDDTGAPPLPTTGSLPAELDKVAAKLDSHQRSLSNDAPLADDADSIQNSRLHDEVESRSAIDGHRRSRTPTRHSHTTVRQSMSAGPEGMHSFRRRGSVKNSLARAGSLRRHASHNSVLSRPRGPTSVATFQTMSSDNDPFFLDRQPAAEAAGPTRQLRRRPGGDLRAADNVHDLEQVQRPYSTGSVSNHTHSITNSVVIHSDRFIDSEPDFLRPVEGPPGAETPRKPLSLVDTHSSQPNLRPSFEAEVAKLAALPDDTDDEGGVESALMKLEGRYEKKSPSIPSQRTTVDLGHGHHAIQHFEPSFQSIASEHEERHATDDVFHRPLAPPDTEGQGMYRLSAENFNSHVPSAKSAGGSTDSCSSLPLLDRQLGEMSPSQGAHELESMASSAKPSPLQVGAFSPQPDQPPGTSSSVNSSMEYVEETESMRRIPAGETLPAHSYVRESFLLDADEDLSDEASAAAMHSGHASYGMKSFLDDQATPPEGAPENLPTHPMRHPPTPPPTAPQLRNSLPNSTVFDEGLPTPGLTPTVSHSNQQGPAQPERPASSPDEPQSLHPSPETTAHLPFIFAYDPDVLAQQFTIVEKDALDEIDWKELIELRWKQSSPQIRDWVQYLRTEEARGVDVVIARFNLVVKWVVSECLLTENIHERAQCIIKFIHIANHARRYRNYATMYQIAIALISNDISSLKKTWALVPAAEMLVMTELEDLVQPMKNFHNLRLEMETSSVDDGCIPFIGVYTRDLIYNAQKPAFIDAPPVDGERLVNFDRHHTAATIVKNLLRLLEASSKYTFKVEPHILSKCLWLAALSDEEIHRRSRQCK